MSFDRRQFLCGAMASAIAPLAAEVSLSSNRLDPISPLGAQPVPASRIGPNDYYPHVYMREGLKGRLYIDTAGKSSIGLGFNVQAPGALKTLQMHGIEGVVRDDIPAAEAWKLGEYDNGEFQGRHDIGPVVAHALYLDRVVPAINDAYAAIQHPDIVGRDRMMIVLDMRYGPGEGTFKAFKGFLAAVNDGDYDRAAFELMARFPNTSKADANAKGPYIKTKWYGQTGNRGVLNVQVMRGAALPATMPDRATMKALKDDNQAFLDAYVQANSARVQMYEMWDQHGRDPAHLPYLPNNPLRPELPPLLQTMQHQQDQQQHQPQEGRPSAGSSQPQQAHPPVTGGRQQHPPPGQDPQPQEPVQTSPQIPPAGGPAIPGPQPPPQGFPSPPPQPQPQPQPIHPTF